MFPFYDNNDNSNNNNEVCECPFSNEPETHSS